jgi:hypothetical protein
VVKPMLAYTFDYHGLAWAEDSAALPVQTR